MITSDECMLVNVIYHIMLFEQNSENYFPLMLYFSPVFFCHSTFLVFSSAAVNSCNFLSMKKNIF